jgi:hypothetical protein
LKELVMPEPDGTEFDANRLCRFLVAVKAESKDEAERKEEPEKDVNRLEAMPAPPRLSAEEPMALPSDPTGGIGAAWT